MCDDNPSWKVLFNMLQGMYHRHPVRIDIAGTIDSIAKIDADLLYKCYNTFYNLHNMVLVIAGNVKTDEVLAIADKLLKPCEDIQLETISPDEPYEVLEKTKYQHLPVGTPLFNIGIKCKPEKGAARLKAEMECNIVGNVISNPSAPLYKKLIDEELINSTFGFEVFCGDGFFTLIFSGESSNPEKVMDYIIEDIERVKVEGLDRTLYDRIKKSTYGMSVAESNNPEAVADNLIQAFMSGVGPYDSIKALSEMTLEDAQKTLCERFDTNNMTISIIR